MQETSNIESGKENARVDAGEAYPPSREALEQAQLQARLARQDLNPLRVFVFKVLPLV